MKKPYALLVNGLMLATSLMYGQAGYAFQTKSTYPLSAATAEISADQTLAIADALPATTSSAPTQPTTAPTPTAATALVPAATVRVPAERGPREEQTVARKKTKSRTVWVVVGIGMALALLRILAS